MTAVASGSCTCKSVRYELARAPIIVHCCHCSWCQRETGSAFAINAVIERSAVAVTGEVEMIDTPSASGHGQKVARCRTCKVALWSHYPQSGPNVAFVRVGTLDEPGRFPPDAHIYTSTKLPWVVLPPGAKAFPDFYKGSDGLWNAEMIGRRKAAMAGG